MNSKLQLRRREPRRGHFERLESRRLLAAEIESGFDSEDFETDPRLIGMFHGPIVPGRPVPRIQGTAPLVEQVEDQAPIATDDGDDTTGDPQEVPPFALDQTFKLHSRPESNFTIYMDFDGHVTRGTTWNSQYGFDEIVHPNYWGGTGSNFSDSRLELIQEIWQIVAEDFAPFDVNVTTEEPTDLDDLRYNGGGDTRWGSRVVMTKDTFASCGCGGHAYLGAFDDPQDEPALVYNGGLNAGSETVSHEVGHQFGLNHDGVGSTTYYRGHGSGDTGWGPIMGAPFGKRTTHWSNGDYFNASNTGQDDLAVITGDRNFPYAPDDHGNDRSQATSLDTTATTTVSAFGIIERNDDVDWFAFSTAGGDVSFDVDVLGYKPNLDVWAGIFDSSGTFIADANPQDSLSASFGTLSLDAGDYYIKVDGVARNGTYDPALDAYVEPDPAPYTESNVAGYSDYGSLGQYRIEGTIIASGAPTVSIAADESSVLEGGTATFTVTTSDGSSGEVVVALRDARQTAPGLPSPDSAEASDFDVAISQTVTITDGTATVEFAVRADGVVERNEYLEVVIVDAGGYAIGDDVAGTEILESLTSYSIFASSSSDSLEGDSGSNSQEFTVRRIGRSDVMHTIGWRRIASGATPADAADFVSPETGTITFEVGETESQITQQIAGDIELEGDETYAIELFVPDGEDFLVAAERASAEGTIREDESTISLSNTAQYRLRHVRYSNGNFDHWAFDNFVISGTPVADDFDPTTDLSNWDSITGATTSSLFPQTDGNALFFNGGSAGRNATTIPISPTPGATVDFDIVFADANGNGLNATENGEDAVLEYSLDGLDWVEIERFDESEYTDWSSVSVTLPEDATFAPTTFDESDSGTNLQQFSIPRLGFLDKAIAVDWTIAPAGENPVSADDFVGGLPSGTANFAAGEAAVMIDIPIAGDAIVEPDETFVLTVTSNSGGPIGNATTIGTIRNDDLIVPEIEVFGFDIPIPDGAVAASTENGTEFELLDVDGQQSTQEFTIANAGTVDLVLSDLRIVGLHGQDFTIGQTPDPVIAPGASTTFEVIFDPTDAGSREATVEIVSNDADESVYDFAIIGKATDVRIEEVIVNGGDPSRSKLTSITVRFNQFVDTNVIDRAFQLRHVETDTVITSMFPAAYNSFDRTEVQISFFDPTELTDGNYELMVTASDVVSSNGIHNFPMSSDFAYGTENGEVDAADALFQHYGDQDGDRDVDGLDYMAFSHAFLRRVGSPHYNGYFDKDDDGDVDGLDFTAFGTNFLKRLPT